MSQEKITRSNPIEIIHVSSKKVSCNGSKEGQNSVFGHPVSYLNMGTSDNVTCPYCGRNFKLKKKS